MSPWFTVEEIDNATFAISEYKHWEETHHELNVPVSLMADVESGFAELHRLGKLQQGEGIIDFGGFQIHI